MFMRICDILSSVCITLGVFNATKSRIWWLVYLLGSILFFIVSCNKELYFLAGMSCLTGMSALRNYIREGKKNANSKIRNK
jgi:hypothetical protein